MPDGLETGWGIVLATSGYIAALVVFAVQSLTVRKIQLENKKLVLENEKIQEDIYKLKDEREQREKPPPLVHLPTPEERVRFGRRIEPERIRNYGGALMALAVAFFGASLFQLSKQDQQAQAYTASLAEQLSAAKQKAVQSENDVARLAQENKELRKIVPPSQIPLNQIRQCDEAKKRLVEEIEKRKIQWLKMEAPLRQECSESCHITIHNGNVRFSLDDDPFRRERVIDDLHVGELTCPPFSLSLKSTK